MVETTESLIEQLIDQLTEERRLAWRRGEPARALTALIDEAWADLRRSRAESQHGITADIIQRARVERELEKLMTDET